MWWNFLSGFFLGLYALLLATMGSFHSTPYLVLECVQGIDNQTIWEAGNTFSEIFLTMHFTIIIMSATFDYFIYFSIPFRLNRIMKTQKEIDLEAREKLLEMQALTTGRVRCCLCCKFKVAPKKVKKNKRKSKENERNKRDAAQEDEEFFEIAENADKGVNKILPDKLKLIFPTLQDSSQKAGKNQDVIEELSNEEGSSFDGDSTPDKVHVRTKKLGEYFLNKDGDKQYLPEDARRITLDDIDDELRNLDF